MSIIRTIADRLRPAPKALRYHFIHIPKNGGSSVRLALKKRGDVSLSDPLHYRYRDIVDSVSPDLSFFCVVRNPWSRTASRFHFGKENARNWATDDPRRQFIDGASFEQFVMEQRIIDIPAHPGRPWMGPLSSWYNQLEWIRDKEGNVACDCLRLEHLNVDINTYMGENIVLPRRNAAKRQYDYRQMYTDELAEIVARVFAEDIDYFGFRFDGPARKNVVVP